MRSKSAAEFEQWFREDIGRHLVRVDPPADLATKIEDQLEGKRRLKFDLRGLTPFTQAVLLKTQEIRRGEVRPYGWIAREIGHPAAVKIVGIGRALPAKVTNIAELGTEQQVPVELSFDQVSKL